MADRLSAPHSTRSYATRGSGYRAWETRRANIFSRAVATLARSTPSLDELRIAADEISEQLARLPDSHGDLPRGYTITTNALGERSLARGHDLYSPACTEPPATRAAIEALAADLRTGWLRELEVFLEGRK